MKYDKENYFTRIFLINYLYQINKVASLENKITSLVFRAPPFRVIIPVELCKFLFQKKGKKNCFWLFLKQVSCEAFLSVCYAVCFAPSRVWKRARAKSNGSTCMDGVDFCGAPTGSNQNRRARSQLMKAVEGDTPNLQKTSYKQLY